MAARKPKGTYDKCGSRRHRVDEPCKRPAGWGTDHAGFGRCKLHGGNTPSGKQFAQKIRVKAEVESLGLYVDVDPAEVIIRSIGSAWANVLFLEAQAQALGFDLTQINTGPGGSQQEVPKALLTIYNQERDRAYQYAASALKLGLDERRVRLAETQARDLLAAVVRASTAIGMSDDQQDRFRLALADEIRRGQTLALPAAS